MGEDENYETWGNQKRAINGFKRRLPKRMIAAGRRYNRKTTLRLVFVPLSSLGLMLDVRKEANVLDSDDEDGDE